MVKRGVEVLAARSGLVSHRLRGGTPSVVVLAYHNVVPAGESPVGDRSLHIPQRRFAAHLDLLAETHEVVSLADAFAEAPPRGRPRAVVTFDDAYVGTLTAGLEETVRRGLPATVFVPPGLLGASGFWWDLLAGEDGAVRESVREHALHALRGHQERVLEWADSEGLRTAALPEHARPASADRVLAAARTPGVTLGSHTWNHVNLAALPAEEARREILRAHDWIGQGGVPCVDWLAYPYGLANAASAAVVEETMDGALLVEGGLAVRHGSPVAERAAVPRVNAPSGLSVDGLALRMAGLL